MGTKLILVIRVVPILYLHGGLKIQSKVVFKMFDKRYDREHG